MGWNWGFGKDLFAGDDPPNNKLGFNTSGWTGDIRGATKATPGAFGQPPTQELGFSLEKDAPKTGLDKANQFLGTNIGKFATGLAGGLVDDYRSRRNTRNKFKDLRGQGLTSYEIAGGGGGGGAVSAQGNTLGSGPATQIQSQQEFTARENAKTRATNVEIAMISSRDKEKRMVIDRPAVKAQTDLNIINKEKARENINLIRAQIRRADFDLHHIWAMKYATMAADNVLIAIGSAYAGVSAEDVLTSQGNLSPEARADMKALYEDIASLKGRGITSLKALFDWMGRDKDEQFLSNPDKKPKKTFPRGQTGGPRGPNIPSRNN